MLRPHLHSQPLYSSPPLHHPVKPPLIQLTEWHAIALVCAIQQHHQMPPPHFNCTSSTTIRAPRDCQPTVTTMLGWCRAGEAGNATTTITCFLPSQWGRHFRAVGRVRDRGRKGAGPLSGPGLDPVLSGGRKCQTAEASAQLTEVLGNTFVALLARHSYSVCIGGLRPVGGIYQRGGEIRDPFTDCIHRQAISVRVAIIIIIALGSEWDICRPLPSISAQWMQSRVSPENSPASSMVPTS